MAVTAIFPPGTPLPVTTELYAAGDWHDVSGDVYQRAPIAITRGVSDETSTITPASVCTFTLDNRSGNYDPGNPMSAYYGTLGRGTPVRINVTAETDSFARTVSNGWGTSDSGDPWVMLNGTASDYAVSAGTATMSVAAASATRRMGTTATWADVDVAVTFSVLNATAITGGSVHPANLMLRGVDSTNYYLVDLVFNTNNTITLSVIDGSGAVVIPATDTGLTHSTTAAQSWRIRAQVEGQTFRAKLWLASGTEPAGWMITGSYSDHFGGIQVLDAPGYVGIMSWTDTGNTNTKPIVYSYSNFVLRVPRYAGNAFFAPSTDISGQDKYTSVTVGSVLRQLGQGATAVQSTLSHDIPSLANLIGYWPCEDGSSATQFASGLPSGGQPMNFTGTPQLASDSTFVGSGPLPVNNSSYWLGYTTNPLLTNTFQVRGLFKLPAAGTITTQTVLMRVHTTGSVIRWDLYYTPGGGLGVATYDNTGTLVNDTGAIGFSMDDQVPCRLAMWATKSGSNLSCQISKLSQGVGAAAGYSNFSVTGQTLNSCYAVAVGPPGNNMSSTVVGQITVESAVSDIFTFASQFNGFGGERATARMARLCGYNGIEFGWTGDKDAKVQTMGPQPPGNLLDLLTSCAASDGGVLFESRASFALMYRSAGAHMRGPAQSVVAALSRTLHQLSDAPAPTYDDQPLRNDVVVTRLNGSSFEAEQTTGPLSTAPPPNGVGVYQFPLSVNCQADSTLPDLGMWALHVGTWPEGRIPQLPLNLASTHLTSSPALWWSLLAVDVDSMISLAGQSVDTTLLLARGYTEQLNAMSYLMAINNAPGAPYLVPLLDDGASRRDSDQSFLTASINSTVTSLSVTVLDGTLWTTASGDWPFDIRIGGERMTVTAVSGSSSPQTFTVTRSVNGVAKAHTHGDQINLFTPVYYALGA